MILDTNALSAFADGESGATARIAAAGQIAIPVVVLGEYRFGIAQSRKKDDYARWLAGLVSACRVLNVDELTASHYATIRLQLKRVGTPIPVNDTWIAALSQQYSLPLLSRDSHFDCVAGLKRIEW